MRELLIIISLLLLSCSKDETIDRLSLLSLAKKSDPTFTIVLAEKLGGGPTCEGESSSLSYGKGCQKVFRAKVGDLEFAFVEFDGSKNARAEAGRLNQFYFKNWVVDEVTTEPALEAFVIKAFSAKNPRHTKL